MSKTETAERPRRVVGAVAQAFRILRVLSSTGASQGVNWIAREAQVNPSTAFNILRTLVLENAVDFDERGKTYKLSPGLLDLCGPLLQQSFLDDVRREMNRLANETDCLVGLWQAQEGGRLILIERATGSRPMRLDMEIKQRLPYLGGAIGRAVAARLKLSDAELRKHFQKLRWEGEIDAKSYIAQVREAEKAGYAVDRETLYAGVVTVAAVLPEPGGEGLYGLTASDIAHKLDDAKILSLGHDMAALVKAFAPR